MTTRCTQLHAIIRLSAVVAADSYTTSLRHVGYYCNIFVGIVSLSLCAVQYLIYSVCTGDKWLPVPGKATHVHKYGLVSAANAGNVGCRIFQPVLSLSVVYVCSL